MKELFEQTLGHPVDPLNSDIILNVPKIKGEPLAPSFLQLHDTLTERRFATRIEHEDIGLTIRDLLEKYVKKCHINEQLEQNLVAPTFTGSLTSIQENLYHLSDSGDLKEPIRGISFRQQGKYIHHQEVPVVGRIIADDTPIKVIDITIDRNAVGYELNWKGFHERRWRKDPSTYTSFIEEILEKQYTSDEAQRIVELESDHEKILFIHAIAQRIWESDFENYSRFSANQLPYKTGDETVTNIQAGRGGICSEKVQALKFLTDAYGLESEYIFVGPSVPNPPPEDILRHLLDTFDFSFSKRHMRYWQHLALLYQLDTPLLVDATNGNIPFLFEKGHQALQYLSYQDKLALPVKMALIPENFYYHRVSQQLPEDLYYAMGNFIPEIDLVQVFDNELGLYIDNELLIAPIIYQSEHEYDLLTQEYAEVCKAAGMRYEFSPHWSLDSQLGEKLLIRNSTAARGILDSKNHLISRYQYFERAEHFASLVLIDLKSC